MVNLRLIQENFQAYLMDENETIQNHIVSPNKAYAKQRLLVYGEGYYLRLVEILKSEFPILLKLVGEESFECLARDYIDVHPSTFFSVRDLGCCMQEFLATTVTKRKAYLSEMAAFEWALTTRVDAPDAPVLTTQEVAAIPPDFWPQMRLEFHPSVQQEIFHWNIPEVWRNYKIDNLAGKPCKILQPVTWSIWRKGLDPYYCPHTVEEVSIIRTIQNKQTFAEICQVMCQWMPEEKVAPYVVSVFHRWINDHLFSHVLV